MCEIDRTQWTYMRALRRLKGHLAHPRHCGAPSPVEFQGVVLVENFKFVMCRPKHCDTPKWAKLCATPVSTLVVSETSPPLAPIHTKPHMGVRRQQPSLMPFWFSLLAFSSTSLVCIRVCFVGMVCSRCPPQPAEPHEWWLLWWWRGNALEAWPTHTSHLNGWNSAWSKRSCMQTGNKVPSLFLSVTYTYSSLAFSHPPSANVVMLMVSLWRKSFIAPKKVTLFIWLNMLYCYIV